MGSNWPLWHSDGQLFDVNVWSVHAPLYTYPDLPRHMPLVEQESLESQHAEPWVVFASVALQGIIPTLSEATPFGFQQVHAPPNFTRTHNRIILQERHQNIVSDCQTGIRIQMQLEEVESHIDEIRHRSQQSLLALILRGYLQVGGAAIERIRTRPGYYQHANHQGWDSSISKVLYVIHPNSETCIISFKFPCPGVY